MAYLWGELDPIPHEVLPFAIYRVQNRNPEVKVGVLSEAGYEELLQSVHLIRFGRHFEQIFAQCDSRVH
jgi:hypothetical protein